MYLRGSAMFQPAICGLQLALLSHSHSFPLLFLTGGKVLLKELSDWGLLGSFVLPWESGLTAKKKLRLIINISLTYNAQQALKEPTGRGKLTPMGGEASITSLWLLPLQSMTSIQYMAHYQVFGLHITTILKTKMKQAFEILLKTSLTLPFNCSVQLCYFLDLWLGNWS